MRKDRFSTILAGTAMAAFTLAGCSSGANTQLPAASFVSMQEGPGEEYVIGPLDELTIHVWRNPELGAEKIQVRPDGRITTPLGDRHARRGQDAIHAGAGYPPAAFTIYRRAARFGDRQRVCRHIQPANPRCRRDREACLDPVPRQYDGAGCDDRSWRPQSNMRAGNKAKLIRFDKSTGSQKEYGLRLADLLKRGESSANVMLKPGDVIIIPESTF